MTQLKLAFFSQPNCTKCPNVKRMIEEIKLKKKIKVAEFDTMSDEGMLEAIDNNLLSTPSIVLQKGGKEIKLVGEIDKDTLISSIEELGG